MSDADFKTFLLQVEAVLPKLELQLKNIDLENLPQVSYAYGKLIMDQRNNGLVQISNIRIYLAQLRVKRTVYGELALHAFLESLFEACATVVADESIGGLTLTSLGSLCTALHFVA